MQRMKCLLLVLALALPGAAWAKFTLKPAPQLWVYAAKLDVPSAQKLVQTYPLEPETLGRALFNSLRRGDQGGSDNQVAIARLLLTHGADPNYTALNGQTLLMVAAAAHDERVVRLLLENGANPDIEDARRLTAVDYAKSRPGSPDAVISLLRRPPPLNPLRAKAAQAKPEVQNVNMFDEDNLITFTFDLAAEGPVCVRLIGSLDGGATYGMQFVSVSGDAGTRIAPGKGKRIVWDSERDYPAGFGDANVIVDVIAEACP